MRIGILTGGGDVPGLNPCIKTVVYNAIERDWQVLGIRRGWAGLLELEPDDPASLATNTLELHNFERLGLDLLIPIGGDDTLSYGERLSREGVPIVAVPKTMDNDVHGTDYCIGFSTAVSRSVAIINQLRSSAGSHERIAVIELFGRNCGETSLLAD